MQRRKENPELKPYINNFLIETLENCELFVKIYGKGFVKERLNKNFNKVYTEELNSRYSGEYSLDGSNSITLFSKGEAGNMLTFKDIEEDPSLKVTTLHEGIHAIFNRTPKECKLQRVAGGTGIHALLNNNFSKELGRAANEGYTNWVCEKAGLKTSSYFKFVNMIKLLELAMGEENIMQLGKGDIKNNIAPLLNMKPEECAIFLSKTDTIYDYDELSRDYFDVKILLENKIKYSKSNENERPKDVGEKFQELEHNSLYKRILKNPDYIIFCEQQNLDPKQDETKLEFFTKAENYYIDKSQKLLEEVHEEILSKYFMKELQEIYNSNDYSFDQYQKFSRISNILASYRTNDNKTLRRFNEKFNVLRMNFCNKALEDIKKSLVDGTISPEKLCYYHDSFSDGDYKSAIQYSEAVSIYMLPEDSHAYYNLFNTLSYNNKLSEIFDYKILKLETESGNKKNLFLGKEPRNSFSRSIIVPKILQANDSIEDPQQLIEITLNNLQSIQEIVNNFLELKNEIQQKSPNTQIQIIDEIIVLTNEENESSYYIIEGNEIVPAKAKELIPQNNKPKDQIYFDEDKVKASIPESFLPKIQNEEENEEIEEIENIVVIDSKNNNFLKTISKNPFKRFAENMRAKLLNLKKAFFKENDLTKKEEIKPETPRINPSKDFDERIRVNVSGKYDQSKTEQNPISKEDNLIR